MTAAIQAHPSLPIITITRDFQASPAQLIRAHLEPELFLRWVGPADLDSRVDYWDARRGGGWRYVSVRDGEEHWFYGSFHEITDARIVQTFTWEGWPDGVSLQTLSFEDLGDGVTRLHAQSLVDSIESRDSWLASGMEVGVDQGYAKLDGLIRDGLIRDGLIDDGVIHEGELA